jgi:hypothetical protein
LKIHVTFFVIDFLDCTTKWLNKAVIDLTTSFPSSDSPSSSSSIAYPSSDQEANNSEPPSLTMVLYQAYLNVLLWDHTNEEFPEVGMCVGALPCIALYSVLPLEPSFPDCLFFPA